MQRILHLGICLCVLLAVGCQTDRRRDSGPVMTGQERMNLAALEGHPQAVRDGFARDFPNSTVTAVQTYDDSAARRVYQINYVRDGQARSAYYTADGRQVPQPVPPVRPME